MLFYLSSRLIGTSIAFLYPAYSSYKTLSQRPASEADLERWLMYWSVLGTLLAIEYFAEWLVSWLPFYYLVKTIFLLYLALPQTQGSTYIYLGHLQPFLEEHEDQIDRSVGRVKVLVWEYVQEKFKAIWDAALGSAMGQPSTQAQNAPQPPTLNDPVSGPAQMAFGLWRTYGPMVMTTGAALLKQVAPGTQQQGEGGSRPAAHGATTSFFSERPPRPQQSSRSSTTQSVLERRRALEEELAALERIDPSSHVQGYNMDSTPSTPSTSSLASPAAPTFPLPNMIPRNASSSSTSTSASSSPYLRERTGSGVGFGRFEEIEIPEDVGHAYDAPPAQRRSSSWFGGWMSTEGYERVKDE